MTTKPTEPEPFRDPSTPMAERIRDLRERLKPSEKHAQLLHQTPGVERLGIPPYDWWSEALHGVARSGKATVFPQAIGLGATFDRDLVFRIATAISDEARAKHHDSVAAGNYGRYTGLTYWSPNVNIFRDPRWGRGHETYGEDPFLTSALGVAYVNGMQGDDPKYLKVAACAKHFAVHSGPEGLRHSFDARVTMRDLWETYLPAFEALVREAGVEIVMGAYNRTNGEPCCAHSYLLGEVLRRRWGFKGHVVSDCWALKDFHDGHNVTKNFAESAALAVKAGCDVNCGCTYEHLYEAVKDGLLQESDIDACFDRAFATRFRLGMFDPQEDVRWTKISPDIVRCDTHVALAREAAAKSCVLLKNDGILPLRRDLKSLYVCGPHAANLDVLLGNYYGVSPRLVSVLEGVAEKVGPGTPIDYRIGVRTTEPNVNPTNWAITEASLSQVAIAVMGVSPLMEGEEGEAIAAKEFGDRMDTRLPEAQLDFLRKLRGNGAKVVLVLTGGGAITSPEIYGLADAILWVGYPGEQGGNGVADVLFGDVSPSGKLPVTFPMSIDDLPPFEDYSMKGRTYRYMEKEPLFPFGFGLSYAKFEYGDARLEKGEIRAGGSTAVIAAIKNTGFCVAEEIVQLYVRLLNAGPEMPNQSLKGFVRLALGPGESREVRFEIGPDALAFAGGDGNRSVHPGQYEIIVASAAPVARSGALGAPEPARARLAVV